MEGIHGASVRIGIVDNDMFALQALSDLIEREFGRGTVLWQETDGRTAVERCLSAESRPDVLLLDMSLEQMSGAEVCNAIRRRITAMPIVCTTSFSLNVYRQAAVQAGAQALVAKADTSDLFKAIRAVLHNGVYPSNSIFQSTVTAYKRLQGTAEPVITLLTGRDAQIMDLIADGYNNAEISRTLDIAESTVKTHIEHILDKLGARNRTHAAALWVEGRL